MKLRCATLNVAGMKNNWVNERFHAAVSCLAQWHLDVLCLQETTLCRTADLYDQTEKLGIALGLEYSCFSPYGNPIEVMSPEQGGIGIASRWPFKKVRHAKLPSAHEHPPDARVLLFGEVLTPEGPLDFATTHLSWKPNERETRMTQLSIAFESLFGSKWMPRRTFILADLNATDDEPVVQLANEYMTDAYRQLHPHEPGYTWLSKNAYDPRFASSDRRLDYIFTPRDTPVLACEVIQTDKTIPHVSDHLGLFAEIEINGAI